MSRLPRRDLIEELRNRKSAFTTLRAACGAADLPLRPGRGHGPELRLPQSRYTTAFGVPGRAVWHRSPVFCRHEYLWQVATGDEEHANVIASAARHVRALGWGIDMALGHGCAVGSPPPGHELDVFKPREPGIGGGDSLRVPIEGSLRSLEDAYGASLNRIRANGEVYDQPGPPTCDKRVYAISGTPAFCAFTLETPDEETVTCRPQQIKALVGMIRHAATSGAVRRAVQRTNQSQTPDRVLDVNRVILGHPYKAAGLRLSILPLPSIGHAHSDGQIRRAILAESASGDGSLCALLSQHLHQVALTPDDSADTISPGEIRLVRLDPADRFLRFYAKPAGVWASVTPVLLPGYDDRKDHRGSQQKRLARAEQLVCKALAQAAIDAPAHIELSRVPFWPGTLHAGEYQPRDKLDQYPRWHVCLTFERPWPGPLIIGAGRHCGFGLFASQDL